MFKVLDQSSIRQHREFKLASTLEKLKIIFSNVDRIPDRYWQTWSFRHIFWVYEVTVRSVIDTNFKIFPKNQYGENQIHIITQKFGILKNGHVLFQCNTSPIKSRWREISDNGFDGDTETIIKPFSTFKNNPKVQLFFPTFEDRTGMFRIIRDLYTLANEEAPIQSILEIRDVEIRREALKLFGFERLKKLEHYKEIHHDGVNILFEFEGFRYIYVKDYSFDKFHLLSVPTTWLKDKIVSENIPINTVNVARAWTYSVHPTSFKPLKCT